MHINFHHLRAFFEVARCQSFTRAAERLHLTQPAISKAVRELELAFDCPLLERTFRHVQLTETGQALFEHAQSIFSLEQAALDDLKARRGMEKGKLVVGGSSTLSAYWLPELLSQFLQKQPRVEIRLVSGNTENIATQVLTGAVDLALVEGAVSNDHLICTPWQHETLSLIAPRHFNPAENLSAACWVVRESGSGTGQVMDNFFREEGIQPERLVIVDSNASALQMVLSGVGLALVPRVMAYQLIEQKQLQELPARTAPITRTLYHVTLKGRPPSPARKAFEQMLATRSTIKPEMSTTR